MTTGVMDAGVPTVRAAIIGDGFMGRVHRAAIRAAGAEVVGVATRSTQGVSVAQLLAMPEVDVVHVCTPNASHAQLAADALAAGKHVVCEKPLATDLGQAAELVAAVGERVAAVPFIYRYHPMVRQARANVATGELGTLLSLDCSYLQDWLLGQDDTDWRTQAAVGGASRAFGDIGSHLCDLIEFVTGDRIATLSARTRRVYDTRAGAPVDTEDLAAVLVQTATGALGTLLVSQMAAGRKNALTLELHGSSSALRFEQERPDELWWGRRDGSVVRLRDPGHDAADSARLSTVPAGHPMGYQDAFNGFVADCYARIRGAAADGLATFDDGLRAMRICQAVLDSAAADGAWTAVA